jgi:hypothetical protein
VLAVQDRLTVCGTGVTPVPESVIVAGEPVALLVMVTVPLSLPATVGLKIALKVSFCEGVSVIGVLAPLSEYPVPATAIWEICTFALPVFVTDTVCVEFVPVLTFPKLREVALSDRVWVATTPVPVNVTTLGETAALLIMEMLPLAEPALAG